MRRSEIRPRVGVGLPEGERPSREAVARGRAEGRSPKAIAKRRASARAGHRGIACSESSARELGTSALRYTARHAESEVHRELPMLPPDQQHPFQSPLPFPVAGEGPYRANRSRPSAVTPAAVLPDMSYSISDTMSICSDPCAPCDPSHEICYNICDFALGELYT